MPLQIVKTMKHDGQIGTRLEAKRFIIVTDRAYFSIDKVECFAKTKQSFVIRLKENIQLNRKKGRKRIPIEDSNIVADFTSKLRIFKNKPISTIVLWDLPIMKAQL